MIGHDLFSMAWILAQTEPGNVFTYFGDSNLAGKVIVLLLVAVSVVAWSVMFGKWMDLKRIRMLNHGVALKLAKMEHALEMNPGSGTTCPYASLVKAALDANARLLHKEDNTALRIGHIENAIQRAVSQAYILYESKMVLLGSIVTAAPFMGLLGTVWGVMDAFGNIGTQSATIQALAPGVTGALLTTVAGLLVAIPSVLGYNYLLTVTKSMVTELENFASSLADRVELEM